MRRASLLAAIVLLSACGSGPASSDGTSGTDAAPSNDAGGKPPTGDGGSGTGDAGPAPTNDPDAAPPPKGEPASGWKTAFAKGGVGLSCAMSEAQMKAAGAPSLTFGATSVYVGFQQIGENQDPVFARFDGGVETYCEHHEKEPPDGRALGFAWDGGPKAYVVYSIVGGGSAFDAKGKGQWLDRYGDGGGSSKVSFLGEVALDSGTLVRGTFVIAKKKDGKTNSHAASEAPLVRGDGSIEFHGESAFQPMNPDESIMTCSGYPFFTKYVFSADLKTLLCSSSTNCASKVPCP